MRNMSFFALVLSSSLLLFFSCSNEKDMGIEDLQHAQHSTSQTITRSQGDSYDDLMVLGDKQTNPYSIKIMQEAANITRAGTLQPTHLYVRFLPADTTQYNLLVNDLNLELFDFPLDYEIVQEGAYYHDPDVPEGAITWQYTTVDSEFNFPLGITYEVLETCYIPDTEDEAGKGETRSGDDKTLAELLEDKAFEIAGFVNESDIETRGFLKRERPEGRFQFWDDHYNRLEPLKGVKVRCHTIVKWSTTFTCEDGTYSMDSRFRIGPHYALVFHNNKGFEMYCNWGPLARANYNLGWHSKKGHSRDFYNNSVAWDWCAVNNAGYEYFQMCEKEGILKPPHNLKVWIFRHKNNISAAPMLNKVQHMVGIAPDTATERFLNNMFVNAPVHILVSFFRNWLPDITIGCKGSDIRSIYRTVNHEFAHASHYSKVGSRYWADYVSYIITYGAYGREVDYNSGVCGVGEMWGYSMGGVQYYEQYLKRSVIGTDVSFNSLGYDEEWFKPDIIWNLYRDRILTKQQIFNCMTSDVRNVMLLRNKMDSQYPAKIYRIKEAFFDYGYYDYKGEWGIQNDTEQTLIVTIDKKKNNGIRTTSDFRINPGESRIIFGRADESRFTSIRSTYRGLWSVTIKDPSGRLLKRWVDPTAIKNYTSDKIDFFVYGNKWNLTRISYNNRYNYLWTFILDDESLAN